MAPLTSNYIKNELKHQLSGFCYNPRMKAGKDYIGVGVGAAIFNKEGKLLITLRGKKAKNERGKWEIPGGSVEWGETFAQAIVREIKEELGIEIEVLELLNLADHIIPD